MDLLAEPSKATTALLNDKITDFCNYALLLEALLVERGRENDSR